MPHRTRWPAVMAVVAILTLLLAFERVVRQVVQQGAMRKAADVERVDATWRCNALLGKQARAECLLALL